VDVESRVVVVETHHDAERDLVLAERVHEAAAERVVRQGPAQGVDHGLERPLGLPDLLDPEREDLRVGGTHLLPLAPGLAQGPAGALGQHGDLCRHVGRLRVLGAGLSVAVQA
jgi:hypothetical protein